MKIDEGERKERTIAKMKTKNQENQEERQKDRQKEKK